MNDLLESALAAHGGLDRWNKIKSITVIASITGAFWSVKLHLGRCDLVPQRQIRTFPRERFMQLRETSPRKRHADE